MLCSFQLSLILGISSVRSQKVNFEKAVWFESTAEGIIAVSTPQAEIIGSATVREHCPTQEISCIVRTFLSMYFTHKIILSVKSVVNFFCVLFVLREKFLSKTVHLVFIYFKNLSVIGIKTVCFVFNVTDLSKNRCTKPLAFNSL